MPSIKLEKICKYICRDVELKISDRELMVLLGPSGAGKTTLLNIIAGLTDYEGSVLFDNQRVDKLPASQREVGYLFQDLFLFPHLDVAANIAYGLKTQKSPHDSIKDRVDEMLHLMKISHLAERYPKQLSGGEKQRVALARALALSPRVLLLDEPLSSLDTQTAKYLRTELKQLQKKLGITTIYVTHDLAEANILADRIAVYHQGCLLQIGSPAEIMRRPADLAVARLTSTQNCFAGEVKVVTAQGLQVAIGPLLLDTPVYPFEVGQKVQCCLRPEQVIMLRPGQEGKHRTNVVRGKIVSIMTDGLSFSLRLCLVEQRLCLEKNYDTYGD